MLVDDFNRADENPLSGGGNWSGSGLALVSNQVRLAGSAGGGAAWHTSQPGDVWVEVDVPDGGTSEHQSVELSARNTGSQYVVAAFYCGRSSPVVYLAGYSGVLIGGYPTFSFSDGDRIGLKCEGNAISLTVNGLVIFTATDTSGSGDSGNVTIGIDLEDFDGGARIDNFSLSPPGGDPPPPPVFSGKRAIHEVVNVGVPVSFAGKRGIHVVTNVGVPCSFTGKRGLHVVTNITDPGPGTPVWQTTFTFKFTAPGGLEGGADGIAFLIKGRNSDWLGSGGGGIGYDGIRDALAVEFDTFANGWDPDGNHIAIHTQGAGTIQSSDSALASVPVGGDFHDGALHTAKITYDGVRLDVYYDDPVTPALTHFIDLAAVLDLSEGANFGLTAGTGSGYETHDIHSWTMSSGNPLDFSYSDFSGGLGLLSVFGDAALVSDFVRLTPSAEGKHGSLWSVRTWFPSATFRGRGTLFASVSKRAGGQKFQVVLV